MVLAECTWSTHTYKRVGSLELQLSVRSPPPSEAASPTPFIFFVHGGSFSSGDRFLSSAWCLAVARQLNWTWVTADYRLIPQAKMTDILDDVRDAMQFTQQSLNAELSEDRQIDPSKAAVMAISAGGFMAMQLCLGSPRPRVYANIYGVSSLNIPSPAAPTVEAFRIGFPGEEVSEESFLQLLADTKDSPSVRREARTGVRLHLGQLIGIPPPMWEGIALQNGFSKSDLNYTKWSRPSTKEDVARTLLGVAWAEEVAHVDFSDRAPMEPIEALDKDFPPTISMHGEADTLVPFDVSKRLTDKLRSLSIDTELLSEPGADHMFDTPFGPQHQFVVKIAAFLKKHM